MSSEVPVRVVTQGKALESLVSGPDDLAKMLSNLVASEGALLLPGLVASDLWTNRGVRLFECEGRSTSVAVQVGGLDFDLAELRDRLLRWEGLDFSWLDLEREEELLAGC